MNEISLVEQQARLEPAYPSDKPDLNKIKRVLMVAPLATGDLIMALPMITAIKNQLPHAEVDVLVVDSQHSLIEHHPFISQRFTLGKNWRKQGLIRSLLPRLKLLKALRARKYDLLLQPSDGSWGAALVFLLNIPYAAASSGKEHSSPMKRWFWNKAYTHQAAKRRQPMGPRHSVESNLDALRQFGIYPTQADKCMVLEPGQTARAEVEKILQAHKLNKREYIVIAPTASQSGKSMNPFVCRLLIRELTQQGYQVVLTGAPVAQELNYLKKANEGQSAINLGGKLNLMQLTALIDAAKCFVGVDSGSMHVASATRSPVVAVYGPGDEKVSGPWTNKKRIVAVDMPCRPCTQNGCGGSGVADCMAFIRPEDIIASIKALTQETT